jgi:hypothetical protein
MYLSIENALQSKIEHNRTENTFMEAVRGHCPGRAQITVILFVARFGLGHELQRNRALDPATS